MSTRYQAGPFAVISAGAMVSNITSLVTIIPSLSMPSYSYSWSGSSPVGTIAVQISNDYSVLPNGNVNNAGTWTSIYCNFNGSSTLANSVAVSGNTGTGFIDVPLTGAYAIRTIYTASTGTGSLTSLINCKVS